MKWDEFAFLNQQLAGLLKTGVPLEGALKQLCGMMQRGELRGELEALEADLARGTPVREALARRKLPPLYVKMVTAGVAGNNLPGMLTMLADHYERMSSLWGRLRSLMIYPAIVLVSALVLFTFIAVILSTLSRTVVEELLETQATIPGLTVCIWLPSLLLGVVALGVVVAFVVPGVCDWLNWRLPGFKESACSRFASTMQLMLQNGTPLPDALALIQDLDERSCAGVEIGRWRQRLAQGQGKFADIAKNSRVFPELFVWLVAESNEDIVTGFGRAAEIFHARAIQQVELMLNAAMPAMVVTLGLIIGIQITSVGRIFVRFLDSLC